MTINLNDLMDGYEIEPKKEKVQKEENKKEEKATEKTTSNADKEIEQLKKELALMKKEKYNFDELTNANIDRDEFFKVQNAIEKKESQNVILDKEVRRKVDLIKNKMDVRQSANIAIFGSSAQKQISDYSKTILEKTKTKDSGEIGDALSNLLVTIKSVDTRTDDEKGFFSRLFNKGKKQADLMIAQQKSVESQLEGITSNLQESRYELLKDIEMLGRLYKENLIYYDNLNAYVLAGKEIVDENNNVIMPQLLEDAAKLTDEGEKSKAVQQIRGYQSNINRLSKRVHDLQTSRTISIMMMPQLKIIENNNLQLADKIQDAVVNVIPAWRTQVLISLSLDEQKKVANISKSVSDAMGEMLVSNSKKIYDNSVLIKEEVERDSVDIDKLEEANNFIIKTIEETLTIEEEAKKARIDSEQRMEKMEEQLRESLLRAHERKTRNLMSDSLNDDINLMLDDSYLE